MRSKKPKIIKITPNPVKIGVTRRLIKCEIVLLYSEDAVLFFHYQHDFYGTIPWRKVNIDLGIIKEFMLEKTKAGLRSKNKKIKVIKVENIEVINMGKVFEFKGT